MENLSITSTAKLLSGYDIPLLGLGVYQNDECKPACEAALKHGYVHIDSAQMYGNEAQVGAAIKATGIDREKVFVTSKVNARQGQSVQQTLSGVETSLQRFGFPYFDLFLIHSPLAGKKIRLETYKALLQKRDEGKIRSVGVSNYAVPHLEEIVEAGLELPTVNQVELHPFCQQRPIVEYCQAKGIMVEAYCPLVRGAFSNPVLQRIVKKTGRTPAQVLVRWSLQKGLVPLPKSSNPTRIAENADVYGWTLSPEDMEALDGLDQGDDGAISWNPTHAK